MLYCIVIIIQGTFTNEMLKGMRVQGNMSKTTSTLYSTTGTMSQVAYF